MCIRDSSFPHDGYFTEYVTIYRSILKNHILTDICKFNIDRYMKFFSKWYFDRYMPEFSIFWSIYENFRNLILSIYRSKGPNRLKIFERIFFPDQAQIKFHELRSHVTQIFFKKSIKKVPGHRCQNRYFLAYNRPINNRCF